MFIMNYKCIGEGISKLTLLTNLDLRLLIIIIQFHSLCYLLSIIKYQLFIYHSPIYLLSFNITFKHYSLFILSLFNILHILLLFMISLFIYYSIY